MNKVLATLFLVVILTSCSNAPNMETGEIKSLQILKEAFDKSTNSTRFVDARNLLSREQVDAAKTPVLFVELASGQNGTLTPYPGQGFGQTWLGADGATITLERGILKASRGMGDDLMGSSLSTLVWSKIYNKTENYNRELSYLSGNNKISNRIFICNINRISGEQAIEIWDITFKGSNLKKRVLAKTSCSKIPTTLIPRELSEGPLSTTAIHLVPF